MVRAGRGRAGARARFAEGRTVAGQFANKSDPYLALFAARLSRWLTCRGPCALPGVSPTEAGRGGAGQHRGARIAADNPAEAERVLESDRQPPGAWAGILRRCQKMAEVDPVVRWGSPSRPRVHSTGATHCSSWLSG